MTRSIKLLGTLEIAENGRLSPLMKSAKGGALLAYLIVTNQSQTRVHIADLFWSETTTSDALRNLRKLLHFVRRHAPELVVTRQMVAFQPQTATQVDYHKLLTALGQDDMQLLDAGLQYYDDNLLATFYIEDAPVFNEWLTTSREQTRAQVISAYHRLCSHYDEQCAWQNGIDAARRWLALDDLHEETHRWLIKFLASSGQIAVAEQQYEACQTRLWEELGVEPEPATQELVAQIKQLASTSSVTFAELSDWKPAPLPEPHQLPIAGALPPHSFLPYQRNHDFTGREADLLRLGKYLLPWTETRPVAEKRAATNKGVVAVSGIGGLGKTQLAVEYAYRYGRFYKGGIYWLNFAQAENIAEEIASIGGERGMRLYRESDKLTLGDQLGRVQQAWQETTPRLLIFDNCEEEKLLEEWLPVTGGCRILVTSRRREWARELNVQVLPVATLSRQESCALLHQLAPYTAKAVADTEQIAGNVRFYRR
ncbi:MAG: BTAD domain-containing putative transcriptional regulator [Chloroflexota bacterium]